MTVELDAALEQWVDDFARRLIAAEDSASTIARPDFPDSIADGVRLPLASAVQQRVVTLREATGVHYVGYKVALTNRRRLLSLGLSAPVHGRLRADGAIASGGETAFERMIRPRVEPEIAFHLRSELRGPDCTVSDVWRATAFVSGAIEIIDSRYPVGPLDVACMIADNVSTARHVLGATRAGLAVADLECLGCVLEIDGEIVGTGAGAQVLGNPAQSVAELANALASEGRMLSAGSVVMSGGLIEATPVQKDSRVKVRFQGLEPVTVKFTAGQR